MDEDEPPLLEEVSNAYRAAKGIRDLILVVIGIGIVAAFGLDWVLRFIIP